MTVYLNTYETYQAYGGPEEGGWWFECGTPVQSVFYSEQDLDEFLEQNDQETIKDTLSRTTLAYTKGQPPTPRKTGYGGYTFAPGSDEPLTYEEDNRFISLFEGHFAEAYPQQRPHYE